MLGTVTVADVDGVVVVVKLVVGEVEDVVGVGVEAGAVADVEVEVEAEVVVDTEVDVVVVSPGATHTTHRHYASLSRSGNVKC